MTATCPRDTELVRLFEEALEQPEASGSWPHVETCARCQGVLEALQVLDRALSEPDVVSHDFLENLLALPGTTRVHTRAKRGVAIAAAAAAVLCVALLARNAGQKSAPVERPLAGVPSVDAPETPPTEVVTPEPTLAELSLPSLHRLVREDVPARARLALVRLGELGRRESLPVLLEALRRADLRLEATRALGALGDRRAVPTLEPLLNDSLVADAAREALVQVGGGKAARALGRAVDVAKDPAQVALLTDALARANSAAGIRRLGQLLGAAEATRVEAARQAIRLHEVRLLPHVLQELESGPASEVGPALGVLEVLAPAAAVPALANLLRHRRHRKRAAEVLMRIDTAEAAEALWGARKFSEARQAFRRGGAATERYLLERLARGNRTGRRAAIDLLGRCGGSEAVSALAALADDPALAPAVLLALGRIGGEAAVKELASLSRRAALRRGALGALGMTGSPAAVAELERLGRSTRSLRLEAQRALAAIPSAGAIEAIVRLETGRRSARGAERVLRVMDRDLVLATLNTILEREPPVESQLAAAARRVRHAVGGPVRVDAPRVALN